MADKIEYSRIITKRSSIAGTVPTIPTGTTLDTLVSTDLFIGEIFLNQADDLMWVRTENGILPIMLSGSSLDTFVTGGTYTNGTATFNNNQGASFNVTGFFTGSTDVFVTRGTYSAGTTTFYNNTGGTFTVTGYSTGSTTPNLSQVLAVGNTTGANNISVNTNQSIVSPAGGQLDFLTGNDLLITNDSGAYADSYIELYSGGMVLGNINFLNSNQSQILSSDGTMILGVNQNHGGASQFLQGIEMYQNYTASTTSDGLGLGRVGITINSNNSTFDAGVSNSVCVGGNDLSATTDNTVYTPSLEIQGTTSSFLLSRLTTTQRNALTAVNGMLIYNTTDNKFQGYENGTWTNLI